MEVAAAGTQSPKAAEVTVGLLALLVIEIVNYRADVKEKFRDIVDPLSELRKNSGSLVNSKDGKLPGTGAPVTVIDYFPDRPPQEIGDWRNWGHAKPRQS